MLALIIGMASTVLRTILQLVSHEKKGKPLQWYPMTQSARKVKYRTQESHFKKLKQDTNFTNKIQIKTCH